MDDPINLALAVLRIAVGATIFAHGWNHLFRGGKVQGTAGWFESLGMKPGILHAWFASVVELGAGVMLIVGLVMPLAGAAVMGTMLVAWITNHRTNGFFIFRPGEGWEYVMNLTAAGFALGVLGAGEWSLDHALDIAWTPGVRLAVTAAAGILTPLVTLAVFWRPAPEDSADSSD